MRLALIALISTVLYAQPDTGTPLSSDAANALTAFINAGGLLSGYNAQNQILTFAGTNWAAGTASSWSAPPASVTLPSKTYVFLSTNPDGSVNYVPSDSPIIQPSASIMTPSSTAAPNTSAARFVAFQTTTPQAPAIAPQFAPQTPRARVMQSLQATGVNADVSPVVAAGLIYQAAAAQGFNYIAPVSGQAIVAKKAGLDWRNMLTTLAANAPLGVLLSGLAGAISLSTNTEFALAGFHGYYDQALSPYLKAEAPNPNDIDPVLQMNGTVSPSAVSCQGNSMFATFDHRHPPRAVTVSVQGISVSFSPQGVAVLRNISGKLIKQFQVIHVLSCIDPGAGGSVVVTPTASLDRYIPRDTPSLRIPPAGFLNTAELTGL